MKDGTQIKVPWSNMRWATLHYRNPNSAFISKQHRQPAWYCVCDIKCWQHQLELGANSSRWRQPSICQSRNWRVRFVVVGGFDFNKSKFNRAIQGYRQPGSTIKPLVYTHCPRKGFSPDTDIWWSVDRRRFMETQNSDGRNLGWFHCVKVYTYHAT